VVPAILYGGLRPLLFALEPERAHLLTLRRLAAAHALGATRLLAPRLADDPVETMGLRFPNPVGLAAGMDKDGAYIDALATLGFGAIEVGTVTPLPQPGNPPPRMFRLPAASGLINRLGFNNRGTAQLVANVAQRRFAGILGINIGKNAATPNAQALSDYVTGLRAVYPHADYVTVNISSPNTRDLRALQGAEELAGLLAGLASERAALAQIHQRRVPLAVKIAPDLDDDALLRVADTLVAHGVDAVIATNTTVARDGVAGLPHAGEPGGLSGAPLRARATAVIARLSGHLQGALPIIGVGGILDGSDAVEKIRAGAVLVQVYTGLIYRGPALVPACRRAIAGYRRGAAAGEPVLPGHATAR
jgi:dihydroorotate dehydrogenase